jgi:hypothetical protein
LNSVVKRFEEYKTELDDKFCAQALINGNLRRDILELQGEEGEEEDSISICSQPPSLKLDKEESKA